MNWHRSSVASLLFVTAGLLFAVMDQAAAQHRPAITSSCVRAVTIHSGERVLVTESGRTCPAQAIQVAPAAPTAPVAPMNYSYVEPDSHLFELFNNSYRDILFLHLFPSNEPDQVEVFGGTRTLAPGRAWSVNLDRGCTYNVLVEYEDGAQNFYEDVDTCSYRGIQLR